MQQKHIQLLLIAGIALILVLGAVPFLFSQNPAPPTNNVPDSQLSENTTNTDGLKLYRNEEWGFEFWYPADWQIRQPAFGSAVIKFNMAIDPQPQKLPESILITVLPNDWVEKVRRNFEADGVTPSEIEVDGVKGEGYNDFYEGLPHIDYFFRREEYWITAGGKKQYEDTLNQILSTFKFLK